jgi:hypothetical protein
MAFRMNRVLRSTSLFAILPLLVAATPAFAGDEAKVVEIAARALSFLEPAPSGEVPLTIVFDPAVPASVSQKDAVIGALGAAVTVGSLSLKPTALPIGDLGSASGPAMFLTTGLDGSLDKVAAAVAGKQVVTIGADTSCVSSGKCVLGVETQPKVQVLVNAAAAKAAGVSFKSAFRMMVKEL